MKAVDLDKTSILKQLIIYLSNSYSLLIYSIVMYKGNPIGILMKNYLDYKELNKVLLNLTSDGKIIVRDKIKFLLYNLVDND